MANYDFFQNKACEYFPCHENGDPETFSCIFCYCPLYALGEHCGGNFTYTKTGIKDCSQCLRPHKRECYEAITKQVGEVIKLVQRENTPAQKTLFFDTNSTNPDGSYYISELAIKRENLEPDDPVTVYQDNEKWTAKVVCNQGTWGIVLTSDAEQISADHYLGHKEGFQEGMLLQKCRIDRILDQLDLPTETAELIKQKLHNF